MTEQEKSIYGNDHSKKIKEFQRLVLKIENKNLELLKRVSKSKSVNESYIFNDHINLVGPNSLDNIISLQFNKESNLSIELKEKLKHAFEKAFEISL